MIKQNQRIITAFQVVIDCILCFASISLAYFIRFYRYEGPHFDFAYYLRLFAVVTPVYVIIYHYFELYASYRHKTIILEIGRIIKANIVGIIFIFIGMFILKEVNISRLVLALFVMINTAISVISRIILRKTLRAIRKNGYNQKHILIIGDNESSATFCEKIALNKNLGYDISATLKAAQFEKLSLLLEGKSVDEVVVSLDYEDYVYLQSIILICEKNGVKVSIIPFYTKYLPARPFIDEIEGIPLINLRKIPLDNLLWNLAKRTFDIFASMLLIIISSPILLITAVGIKITSRGVIIYKQRRIGLNKKIFTMYKFRSMEENAIDETAWSSKGDPRKTGFGTFIRKYSIDELPQFFNVFKGDMSLVGPRPEIPFYVEKFKEEVPLYMVKHQVRPGITGWAQVNGWRGDTSIEERIKCDIDYIENWTFMLDVKILVMTVFKGFINREE